MINKIKLNDAELRAKYLDPIAKKTGLTFSSGKNLKLAFVALCADIAGLKDKERAEFFDSAMSTPGWIGSGNPSAADKAYSAPNKVAKIGQDYSGF